MIQVVLNLYPSSKRLMKITRLIFMGRQTSVNMWQIYSCSRNSNLTNIFLIYRQTKDFDNESCSNGSSTHRSEKIEHCKHGGMADGEQGLSASMMFGSKKFKDTKQLAEINMKARRGALLYQSGFPQIFQTWGRVKRMYRRCTRKRNIRRCPEYSLGSVMEHIRYSFWKN